MGAAYLEITLKIDQQDRPRAAAVYRKYRQPFLDNINGSESKALLVREDDVQVLHRFDSPGSAEAYLGSELFKQDVVSVLAPLLKADPEIRIYSVG